MAAKSSATAEKTLYDPIREYLTEVFRDQFGNCHLEVTANGVFSGLLKKLVRYDIIFSFLGRRASPDLTGFIHTQGSESVVAYGPGIVKDFITVEIKREPVTLQDIYKAKMYGDLFQAKYALLISPEPIPEEIRRLDQQLFVTHRFMSGWVVYIGEWLMFEGDRIIHSWLPRSPF